MTAFLYYYHTPLAPHNLPKPHYPLLCTITRASLVKGRWIDGKAQALILLLSACDMPTIFMLQTFCRQDGGIALHSHHPQKNRTVPRKSPSPLPFNERSVISHPHYPSRFSYCNRLYALICFHIRTIPPTFRRVRVCVCLVGFASLQSPWAHTLRHPCLARSSRCTNPCCLH